METSFALARTAAFRDFKSAAGQNNHFVVTILVGLSEIEREEVEPDEEFSSRWSPRDHVSSARRSREYALQSSLVWILELLNSLRSGLASTPTAFTTDEVERIRSTDGARDKLHMMLQVLELKPTSDFHMCELAITWRNRVVHSPSAERSISSSLARSLLRFEDDIRSKHRGLAVSECISAYNQGRAPTFKAVTSFIQAAQDLAWELDRATVSRVSPDEFAEASIKAWAQSVTDSHAITKTWGGPADQTRRRIQQLLITCGMKEVEASHPRALNTDYFHGLLGLDPADARIRFLAGGSGRESSH